MASDLADDDIDDIVDDDSSGADFDERRDMGGRDSSIRRKIEERLERKRLMDELDLLDDFDL
ncbi:PA3496 family putative envelope integrity protein [Zhongshania guokunii]|uniref:PA3496 family putative envelope integrity protein n=1 Tax=Zhongshania guokunii TaxID=641783 RepID=A0ABV3U3I8_9GAMM